MSEAPPKFVARTASPTQWKAIAAAIQNLTEEATFEATAEGLTFRSMDPSHIALLDLFWPGAAFESYQCAYGVKFTVRVEDFAKLVRRAEAHDRVELSLPSKEMLRLQFQNGYGRDFQLHLFEGREEATPLPKLTFSAKLLVTQPLFTRVINDVLTVSDHLRIETDAQQVVFSGKSDAGEARIRLERGHQDLLELEVKEPTHAIYSIDYLLNLLKAVGGVVDTVQVEYGTKLPLRLELKLDQQGGRLHFYLAPRVEER